MTDEETAHFRVHLMTEREFQDKVGYMPPKHTKKPAPTTADIPWDKIRDLIMKWAQDDGTNDELMDLLDGTPHAMDGNEFWEEFEARLKKAFG